MGTKRVVEEAVEESQNSISLELDAKGNLKPSVKFYFEDRSSWQAEADRAIEALAYLLEQWERTPKPYKGGQGEGK